MTDGPDLYSLHRFAGRPDDRSQFAADWNAIVTADALKNTLLRFVDTLHRLGGVPPQALGLRRAVMLFGPPGCGKTSLARGLPYAWHRADPRREAGFMHVNTHALFSGLRGGGQKLTLQLFQGIGEQASLGIPLFVLIDEVETLGSNRGGISLETNPLDAMFQVTAFLEALDAVTRSNPNVIFIFTTNIPKAIDRAVRERVDFSLEVPPPGPAEREEIMRSALSGLAAAYDVEPVRVAAKKQVREWRWMVQSTEGMSGRALRHVFVLAATLAIGSKELTIDHVADALTWVTATEAGLENAGGMYLESFQGR
ncbi:AAA family ATPase [Paractinoplanes lichenicola]|uniref:AAA family ATPase n=1 Tax=Paractinoplanes lichenicola TaxID=2802976 RepID=A0ABS1VRE1_9ACTN|nr:AAA family ATPase [Actinoplanes lichenicola]MBL7257290.1 AAA family ATPase [Actinoplanes lichenicola]